MLSQISFLEIMQLSTSTKPIFKKFFLNNIKNKVVQLGENMVKRAKGAKVKVLFLGLHMTCVIFVLIYNF
jgi:hypothetical protein